MKYAITILGVITLIAGVNPAVLAQPQTLLTQGLTKDLTQQGGTKLESGDYKGAIEIYNQALRLNANDSTAYVGRGRARFALGDKQGAVQDFTQALSITPNDASIYRLRAGVYLTLGEKKEAKQDLQQALSISSGRSQPRQ